MADFEDIRTICENANVKIRRLSHEKGVLDYGDEVLIISRDWIARAEEDDDFFEILYHVEMSRFCSLDGDDQVIYAVTSAIDVAKEYGIKISVEKQNEMDERVESEDFCFDFSEINDQTTLIDLIDEYGLPLKITMSYYYGDFYFLAQELDHETRRVIGEQYLNGEPYKHYRYSFDTVCTLFEEDYQDDEDGEEEEIVEYKDLFIHSNGWSCHHSCKPERVKLTMPVYSSVYEDIVDVTFEAEYCPECGIYYISERVYQREIKPLGRLLCQLMSMEEFEKYKENKNGFHGLLRKKSILNMMGYNVNAREDLSDEQRQTILQYAIESGVTTKKNVLYYLENQIMLNEKRQNQELPNAKRRRDIKWVEEYDGKGKIRRGVRRIIYN